MHIRNNEDKHSHLTDTRNKVMMEETRSFSPADNLKCLAKNAELILMPKKYIVRKKRPKKMAKFHS